MHYQVATDILLRGSVWYLDPGSGSYLIQLLIAGVMGGLILLRVYWTKVVGFFRQLMGKSIDEDDE
jgi:hypothetical protein